MLKWKTKFKIIVSFPARLESLLAALYTYIRAVKENIYRPMKATFGLTKLPVEREGKFATPSRVRIVESSVKTQVE
jgi:folate-dependent tRNA-U54 methylase TrmFO/GidA